MQRVTKYHNKNGDWDSTTRSPHYEERRYGNSSVERPPRRKPQRERHFKPNKWTIRESPMMCSHPVFGSLSGGPPFNTTNNMNIMHSQMPWQMQMQPNRGTSFVPQHAGVGGFSGGPPLHMQPQMSRQMQISSSDNATFAQPDSTTYTSPPPPPPATAQTPVFPPLNKINIDELFQKLVSSGVLRPTAAAAATPKEEAPQPIVTQPIDLANRETIKTRRMAPVDKLYSGMQCSSCCKRFPPKKTNEYSRHLDWHFRQNRLERDQSSKASSREWYSSVTKQMQYVAGEDAEKLEKNDSADIKSNLKRLDSPISPSCPALPNGVDKACEICQEEFEQFFHDESEEWHLRNAIRVDDKIYHSSCYKDYKLNLSKKSALNIKEDEHVKTAEKAAAPPSNWTEWKALKLKPG